LKGVLKISILSNTLLSTATTHKQLPTHPTLFAHHCALIANPGGWKGTNVALAQVGSTAKRVLAPVHTNPINATKTQQ